MAPRTLAMSACFNVDLRPPRSKPSARGCSIRKAREAAAMIEIFVASYNGRSLPDELAAPFGTEGGTLGRGADNRLILPDPARHVSRVQARIRYEAGRFLLANVSSANPMFVNDAEIESAAEVPIAPGDELRVGLYVLGVREGQVRAAAASSLAAVPMTGNAAGAVAAPVIGGSVDPLKALAGTPGIDSAANPFADLIGQPAPLAVASHSADRAPMPMSSRGPAVPSIDEDPGASAGAPRTPLLDDPLGLGASLQRPASANTWSQEPLQPQKPNAASFDWAQPAGIARNSDNPLEDLASGATNLGDIANDPQQNRLIDFPPGVVDPRDPLQPGTPSVLDGTREVDPLLSLLEGLGTEFGGARESDGGPPMRDDTPELRSVFTPPAMVPDAPALVPATRQPDRDATQNPLSPPVAQTSFGPPPSVAPIPSEAPAPSPSPAPVRTERAMAASDVVMPAAPPAVTPAPITGKQDSPMQQPGSGATAPASGEPAAASAEHDELLAAFLRGARVADVAPPVRMTPALMEMLGSIVYHAIAGAMELTAARQITKHEMRAEVTMIVPHGNNPLKFLPSAEAVIMHMLGPTMPGFKATAAAVQEVFDDLRAHEVGVIAGMRAALTNLLQQFDPASLERAAAGKGALEAIVPAARQARLWKLFETRFRELHSRVQDDAQLLFGDAFTRAYEEEVERDRARRRNGQS